MATTRDKILAAAQRFIDKGNLSRAIKEYLKLLETQPDDTRTRLRVGDLQTRLGKKSEAVETYELVAEEYSSQGFFLKSVAILKQILRLDPSRTDVQIRLAELYLKLNLLSDSMAQYRSVADRFHEVEDHDRYVEVLQRMAELDPDDVRTQITLAEHYSGQGRMGEAAAHFALATDGLRDQERWDEYIKVAERYIFHNQDDIERITQLVYTYIERRDFKRALAKLQLVFKTTPKDVEALKLLVACFLGLRKRDKAVRVLKELAETYIAEGQEELVVETYQRILQLEPNDIDARAYLGLSLPSGAPLGQQAAEEEDPLATSTLPFEGSQPIRLHEIRDNGADQWRRLKAASGLFTTPSGLTTCNSDVGEPELEEISRLMVEIDGFEKLGLIERSRAALKRVFELDPLNISGMERAVRIDVARGNLEGAIQRLLRMTQLCWRPDPVRAAGYLNDALQLAPNHEGATALRAELGLDDIDLETFMLESTAEEDVEVIDLDESQLGVSDLGYDYEPQTIDPGAGYPGIVMPDEPEVLRYDLDTGGEPLSEHDDALDEDLFLEPDVPSVVEAGPAHEPSSPTVFRGTGSFNRVSSSPQESSGGGFGDEDESLPPLPEDLPDDLVDDLHELQFLLMAGQWDDAQTLLFELTTTYPSHAVLIMERMALLEALQAK